MKKALAFILALVMVFALVACGEKKPSGGEENEKGVVAGSNKSASGETDKDVYIDFWGVWAQDNKKSQYWIQKAEEFCAQYEKDTGISVAFEYFGQGSYQKLSEKLAAGAVTNELPVISQIEDQATATFYTLAADLSKYLSKEAIDNYMDGLLVSCTQKGVLRAVPAGRSYVLCTVNVDLLEQAGHKLEELDTWTWDDYVKITTDIAALGDDIYGTTIYWDEDAWPWESALYSEGGNIDNEDGTKIVFADDGGKAAAKVVSMYVDLVNKGVAFNDLVNVTMPGDADWYPLWADGKLGMYIASITSYKSGMNHRDGREGGSLGFRMAAAHQPAGAAGFSVVTGGSNMMIMDSATETQKKIAAAYFEYLAQDDNAAEWMDVSGYMAVTEGVRNSEAFKKVTEADPNLLYIYEHSSEAHARPTTAKWQEMYLNVLMQGEGSLFDISVHPDQWTDPAKVEAQVCKWAEACQKIIDEAA